MNGYLVIGRMFSDDVPMRFFELLEDAVTYAANVDAEDVVSAGMVSMYTGDDPDLVGCIGYLEFRCGMPASSFVSLHDLS